MPKYTTATITTAHHTDAHLQGHDALTITVLAEQPGGYRGRFTVRYTVGFDNEADALAAVEAARNLAITNYLRGGGNPRNRRAFASQFAAVTKAIRQAVDAHDDESLDNEQHVCGLPIGDWAARQPQL